MPQLVGQVCVLCEQRIGSVVDGCFCDVCGKPAHRACRRTAAADAGACAGCGYVPRSGIEAEAGVQREPSSPRRSVPPRMLIAALLLQLIALPQIGVAIWVFLMAPAGTRDVGIYVGSCLLVVSVIAEVVSFGLLRLRRWARPVALALFIFCLPGGIVAFIKFGPGLLYLPIAVAGIACLLGQHAQSAFPDAGESTGGGGQAPIA
jgi:hypothetical protein